MNGGERSACGPMRTGIVDRVWGRANVSPSRTSARFAAAVAFACLVLAFVALAGAVTAGDTSAVDEWAVRSLRRVDDPAVPVGPPWLREVGIDVTALGSVAILILFTSLAAGFLLLQARRHLIAVLAAAMAGGLAVNWALKHSFDRTRPEVVPHLREVTTPSFPSGHASLSAVVFLTFGVLAARGIKSPVAKAYCVAVAALLSFLVGVSRVYLGVHYPTDVVAGWLVGAAWALLCWLISTVRPFRHIADRE